MGSVESNQAKPREYETQTESMNGKTQAEWRNGESLKCNSGLELKIDINHVKFNSVSKGINHIISSYNNLLSDQNSMNQSDKQFICQVSKYIKNLLEGGIFGINCHSSNKSGEYFRCPENISILYLTSLGQCTNSSYPAKIYNRNKSSSTHIINIFNQHNIDDSFEYRMHFPGSMINNQSITYDHHIYSNLKFISMEEYENLFKSFDKQDNKKKTL